VTGEPWVNRCSDPDAVMATSAYCEFPAGQSGFTSSTLPWNTCVYPVPGLME
jgi:hypothetical protein